MQNIITLIEQLKERVEYGDITRNQIIGKLDDIDTELREEL